MCVAPRAERAQRRVDGGVAVLPQVWGASGLRPLRGSPGEMSPGLRDGRNRGLSQAAGQRPATGARYLLRSPKFDERLARVRRIRAPTSDMRLQPVHFLRAPCTT
mmetsp:Transcript_11493/g.33142  ORF Transcript_11493/g.33142 Transcript_11493/m.33142 type:complete len:105 (-) Transcript_11493:306-620(-)